MTIVMVMAPLEHTFQGEGPSPRRTGQSAALCTTTAAAPGDEIQNHFLARWRSRR
jgi:hypothetical protein